jgi:hypothetical protein
MACVFLDKNTDEGISFKPLSSIDWKEMKPRKRATGWPKSEQQYLHERHDKEFQGVQGLLGLCGRERRLE